MSSSILLLGGTGAMGVHLVNTLKRSKYEVVVTSRKERKSEENITYVTGNAKDKDFLKKILSSRYKAIFNFMTYTTEEFRDVVNLLLSSTDHYFFLSSPGSMQNVIT